MAIAEAHRNHRAWRLCPFWQSPTASSSSSSTQHLRNQSQSHSYQNGAAASRTRSSSTVSSVARSLLPARRRLRLDPSNNLYFPYEPGKQARSAVRIKNTSKSHVAFKFQTTSPKSCYMRPPGGVLAPGESLTATVFKFVEHPENNEKLINQKSKVKFKIMSLKVKQGLDYIPELLLFLASYLQSEPNDDRTTTLYNAYSHVNWVTASDFLIALKLGSMADDGFIRFDEQRDQVTVERILRMVFLDPESTNPALEKLKYQLAEADTALEEIKKKPSADAGPRVNGEGLVLDEWKERREKYLALQQVEAVDSV